MTVSFTSLCNRTIVCSVDRGCGRRSDTGAVALPVPLRANAMSPNHRVAVPAALAAVTARCK